MHTDLNREPFVGFPKPSRSVCLVISIIFLIAGWPIQSLGHQRLPKETKPWTQASQPAPMPLPPRIRRASSQEFLEDLERRSFRYFWEQADANTGLVLDRTKTDGTPTDENHRVIASIAATGFGLTALCIASERRWIPRAAARQRVRNTLRFFAERALHEHGWFYHWMDFRNGDRKWKSEISSIDTALLLAGILTAKQYFHEDAEIVRFATKIYERIDFPWMLNGHPTLLSMGWHPETGFIKARWDNYSEHPILYLMAIGSPTHPLRPDSWYAWERNWNEYHGLKYLGKTPLFTYQYSHAWVDFRNRREDRNEKIDYFRNSVDATLAHRLFCMELATEFPAYGPDMWGISASDSIKGYIAWGGPPRDPAIDGTVVPYVPAGSLMFVPELGLSALQNMRRQYGNRIYGKYGFTDAFNPNTGWVNPDVIGIDLGITILGAENARTQNVWHWFMRNPEITKAMELIGLRLYERRSALIINPIGDRVRGLDVFDGLVQVNPIKLDGMNHQLGEDVVRNQLLPNL